MRGPATIPSTLTSSSKSSQRIPSPPPISRNCCLSLIDARRRRGYHTNGTETLRPSTRSTTKASSVSCARTARNDDSSITKVVIPHFPERLLILCNPPGRRCPGVAIWQNRGFLPEPPDRSRTSHCCILVPHAHGVVLPRLLNKPRFRS
jgi:hypothetical protein